MNEFSIGIVDLSVVIGYFLLVLAIGLYIGRKTKTGDELFLGGRRII